jgi:hypothetical protein
MLSSFETTLSVSRPVAQVLGDDWVEVEPGIYVQSVDAVPPPLGAVRKADPSHDPSGELVRGA